MPAPPLSNNNDGGSDNVQITTANSGGSSGDAWSAVTIGAGCALIYSADQSHSGKLSSKHVQPATGAQTFFSWTTLGAGGNSLWGRFYVWRNAFPVTQRLRTANVRTTTDTQSAGFYIDTAGLLGCENAASGTIAGLNGTIPIALKQWVRIEFRVLSSTTVGEAEWRLFNDFDSTLATETKSATGLVLGATSDAVRWGNSVGAPPASETMYLDDLALSTVTWLGPAVLASPTSAFM